MVALGAESGGDGRRRKIEGRLGERERKEKRENGEGNENKLLHECFQVFFFFFKKKKKKKKEKKRRRGMCHIGRDGEENEMRMHRSISLSYGIHSLMRVCFSLVLLFNVTF
jgi:hypothetical protein